MHPSRGLHTYFLCWDVLHGLPFTAFGIREFFPNRSPKTAPLLSPSTSPTVLFFLVTSVAKLRLFTHCWPVFPTGTCTPRGQRPRLSSSSLRQGLTQRLAERRRCGHRRDARTTCIRGVSVSTLRTGGGARSASGAQVHVQLKGQVARVLKLPSLTKGLLSTLC